MLVSTNKDIAMRMSLKFTNKSLITHAIWFPLSNYFKTRCFTIYSRCHFELTPVVAFVSGRLLFSLFCIKKTLNLHALAFEFLLNTAVEHLQLLVQETSRQIGRCQWALVGLLGRDAGYKAGGLVAESDLKEKLLPQLSDGSGLSKLVDSTHASHKLVEKSRVVMMCRRGLHTAQLFGKSRKAGVIVVDLAACICWAGTLRGWQICVREQILKRH
jgi:hypothetical protein